MFSQHATVKRTYASRRRQLPSSPRTSSLPSSPSVPVGGKRKRALLDCVSINAPPPKRVNVAAKPQCKLNPTALSSKSTPKEPKARSLTQLHFVVDSTLRTCPSCLLSYTKGANEDEAMHKKHCARVQRGLEWGKEEEKGAHKAGVRVVEDHVRITGSTGVTYGRIIAFPAYITGKIGIKLTSLLETINLTLSSPELSPEVLKCSRAYLFLIPSSSGPRERIAGCLIAQRITHAMNVIPSTINSDVQKKLVRGDGGLYCSLQLHPTPLGISRLFVPSTHRRHGIAQILLSAAAKTFIHGCKLDPTKGEVAFSQPTGDGQKVMENWGNGGIRIYED